MVGLVQIHPDAHRTQRRIALRSPRGAGLSVGDQRGAEDPRDVAAALRLAALELRAAVVPSCVLEVHGNGRLLAVRVGVVADLVLLHGGDDVRAAALLEDARLLADDLEGRLHPEARQHLCKALCGVVILRKEVVLGVEPQDDMDRRGRLLRLGTAGQAEGRQQRQEQCS